MSREEKRAGASLAAVFALRMLGMFLILPVFAIYAQGLAGGDNLTLVGLALGAYGLTQALFQIPFGMASDRFGRKPVIVAGLLLFAFGAAVAALADDIHWVIAGRVIQGAGAISAAVTALAADLTREEHRTKVMAMIGSSIGLVFAISLVVAPMLYAAIGMSGIFWLTGFLALAAIALVSRGVPNPPPPHPGPRVPFREVLTDSQLLRLNLGIFTLHMSQMMLFVVVPGLLVSGGNLPLAAHWKVYLPAVLASFVLMVPAIIYAEKRQKLRQVFVAAIGLLLLTLLTLSLEGEHFAFVAGGLVSFFVAFNILEAMLPSLISRVAPPRAKGAALGVYNTTQALGLFCGGALGGFLAKHFGPVAVFAFAAGMTTLWLLAAASMQPIRTRPAASPTRDGHGILETKS
ncbi:MAG: MFS transporter [Betaproteobacteria bacterium HGW-Betaproteobacteria-11]|nr:MAG: MFS transporter [Betaproteobacteria bacterium HGW-Betaproteobacteria-11]